jgi:hypothetical protein
MMRNDTAEERTLFGVALVNRGSYFSRSAAPLGLPPHVVGLALGSGSFGGGHARCGGGPTVEGADASVASPRDFTDEWCELLEPFCLYQHAVRGRVRSWTVGRRGAARGRRPALVRSSLVLRQANPYGDDRHGSPDRARSQWGSARLSALPVSRRDPSVQRPTTRRRRRRRSAVRSS